MQGLTRNRFRKNTVGLASLLAFLLFVGTSPLALAADDWPTWPPKKTVPAPEESPKGTISEEPAKEGVPAAPAAPPPAADAAAKAGKTAGKSASAGISKGTMGWAAAIIGAGVLIGVAAGGGGGGSTSGHP